MSNRRKLISKDSQLHISDAARRISDTYNLHRLADPIGNIGRWFASKLIDGTTDNILYDSRSDAVWHQKHNEQFYMFTQIVPATMSEHDSETRLQVARRMQDAGIRMIDRDAPNGGRDMIPRMSTEDQSAQISSMFRGTKPKNILIPGRDF